LTQPHSSARLFDWKTVALGTSSAACWGISTVITKGVLESVPPLTLLVIQLIFSNAFLWAIVRIQGVALPTFIQGVRAGLPGLLQPGLAFIAGIIGLSLTTASVEALIWSMETVMIIGLAWVILGERVNWTLIGLSLLGVLGIVMVNLTGQDAGQYPHAAWGAGLIFLGTFCAALYTVVVRHKVTHTSPLLLVTLNQSVGLVGVLGVWFVSQIWMRSEQLNLTRLNLTSLSLAALSGVMLHALPFWLFTIVLKRMSASLSGLFLILIPLFTISGACLFLGETLTRVQWIGAGLIVVAMGAVSGLYQEEGA
jgi:drug/metabolite transporter (DMT)-like permease